LFWVTVTPAISSLRTRSCPCRSRLSRTSRCKVSVWSASCAWPSAGPRQDGALYPRLRGRVHRPGRGRGLLPGPGLERFHSQSRVVYDPAYIGLLDSSLAERRTGVHAPRSRRRPPAASPRVLAPFAGGVSETSRRWPRGSPHDARTRRGMRGGRADETNSQWPPGTRRKLSRGSVAMGPSSRFAWAASWRGCPGPHVYAPVPAYQGAKTGRYGKSAGQTGF
jgi:hypothetical protein